MQSDTNDIPLNRPSFNFFEIFDGASFGGGGMGDGLTFFASVFDQIFFFWDVFSVLSILISLVLLYGIVYTYMRAGQLSGEIDEFIASSERAYTQAYEKTSKNTHWEEILQHIDSDRPNDWKFALIEADVMLQEVLDSAGYPGASIGEKLKNTSPQSFKTLDMAWRAHKIRNQVAHSGSDFVLTKNLAQETITQYKMVFEEFGIV